MSGDWVYGLVAEFGSDKQLMHAAEEAYAQGYGKWMVIRRFRSGPGESVG